ncbi:UNVERIFIED_CONTAM: hypothetical protein FQV15_0010000, partial [Eudyptes pachyrhynchus]
FKHSPTIAHSTLAKELCNCPLPPDITLLQYINDISIGDPTEETVHETATKSVPTSTLDTLLNMSSPKDKKSLQECLGSLGFWRDHIPLFAQMAPCHGLT